MPDNSLKYNVRWIDNTFTSRSVTESLLSTERESGNITANDYESATRFFPGFHRHYSLIGGISGIPVMYAARRPSWSNAKAYLFLISASITGSVVGHTASLIAHYRFVRSIENPGGFSHAMDNIQRNIGGSWPQGPVIVRLNGKWSVDHDPDTPPLETNAPTAQDGLSTREANAPGLEQSRSKWDQIRAANARITGTSSWDTLRQTHEKKRVSNQEDDIQRTRDDDREAEQSRFDALLEKERNMK